jgi:RNA polymerase sigma-70 factor (ECF subfamily)
MESRNGSATSLTLLGRLRCNPNDQQAWNAFVERYGRQIYGWTRARGLQEADAQDVTQTVLADLALQMSKFEYRPSGSFRTWLRTIAYRVWCDFLKARQRAAGTNSSDEIFTQLASPDAGEDLLCQLEAESERELMEEAMARVRIRVQPQTWSAFVMTALESKSGAEAAEALGLKVGTVWVARSKVTKMLQEEIKRLDSAPAE